MAQKIKKLLIVFSLIALVGLVSSPMVAFAAADPCGDNCSTGGGPSGNTSSDTSPDVCENTTDANGNVSNAKVTSCLNQSPIIKDLQTIVNFLSAGVGVVVVAAIVVGGVQYTLAGDNPQALGAAKKRITDALIALVAFMLIFSFLQWLIPGGVFS